MGAGGWPQNPIQTAETTLDRQPGPVPSRRLPFGTGTPYGGGIPSGEPGNWADFIICAVPGIEVECYEGAWETLEQMKKQKPVAAKTAATIDMSPRTQEHHSGLGEFERP